MLAWRRRAGRPTVDVYACADLFGSRNRCVQSAWIIQAKAISSLVVNKPTRAASRGFRGHCLFEHCA